MRFTRPLQSVESAVKAMKPPHNPYNALTQVFEYRVASEDPLSHGLRYAAKENFCTTTGATTCCSRILGATSDRPYRSPFNATCIELLNKAGNIMVAKTNMDEFGMGSFNSNTPYGPVLNPISAHHTSGGSSGGSAAALSMDDIVGSKLDFSLGTDTGGSIRTPAAYCGHIGFKPSYGRISRYGIVPYANSLDTVGILARRDLGLQTIRKVFQVIDHFDPKDPTSLSLEMRTHMAFKDRVMATKPTDQIRVGIPGEYNIAELSPAILESWKSTITRLQAKGIECVPVALPLTKTALSAYYILAPAEASSNLQKYSGVFYGARESQDRENNVLYAATRSLFGDEVKRRIIMGTTALSSDRYDNFHLQAQRTRRMMIAEFNAIFNLPHPLLPNDDMAEPLADVETNDSGRVDYLLTPVTISTAPRLDQVSAMSAAEAHAGDVFTVPASLAGLPAISVPAGTDALGLPIGMQIIGQYGADRGVLDFAKILIL